MRRFQAEKEDQLASVSEQINEILNLIVETSACPLPAINRSHGGLAANGFKSESLKTSGPLITSWNSA